VNNGGFATEGEFEFAFEQREHFLEIMPVRRWPATGRHQHVDQAIAPGGLRARHQDGVGAAGHRNMGQAGAVGIGHGQAAAWIVGRNCVGHFRLPHGWRCEPAKPAQLAMSRAAFGSGKPVHEIVLIHGLDPREYLAGRRFDIRCGWPRRERGKAKCPIPSTASRTATP
jgi:hypothetical protein